MTAKENIKLIGFHATNNEITELNYADLLDSITNHDNGALGLWCSFDHKWIGSFGRNIYRVTVEDACTVDLSVDKLAKMSQTHSREDYTAMRDRWLREGYHVMRLIEADGHCAMFVLLDFDRATLSLESKVLEG